MTTDDINQLRKRIETLEGDLKDRREELRGVFAIGALAALVAYFDKLSQLPQLVAGLPISFLTLIVGVLLVCWTLYVISMAIGVSTDYFSADVTEAARVGGRILFVLGVASIFVVIVIVAFAEGIVWASEGFQWIHIPFPTAAVIGFGAIYIWAWLIGRRKAKKDMASEKHI